MAKRKFIRESLGAISWRQGEIGGRSIYHVLLSPYTSQQDYLTVVGRKPQGAALATGKGSALRTIRQMTGKAPGQTIRLDMGIQDVAISPKGRGVTIAFKPDREQQTTGDITIGPRRLEPITKRTPPLSKGATRITPKTPKLRK